MLLSPSVRLSITVLATAAAIVSGWLAVDAASALATCGEGSGCDNVLLSSWSRWFNVPVSAPAAALYTVLAVAGVLTFVAPAFRRQATTTLLIGTTIAAIAAAWFVGLQVVSVGAFCQYCLIVHGCGVAAWLLTMFGLVRGRQRPEATGPRPAPILAMPVRIVDREPQAGPSPIGVGATIAVAVLVLIAGQLASSPPETHTVRRVELADEPEIPADETPRASNSADPQGAPPSTPTVPPTRVADSSPSAADPVVVADDTPPEPSPPPAPAVRQVAVLDGKISFGVDEVPILGDPEAPLVVVELFDYSCPRCRKMAQVLKEIQAHYDNRVAFALLPVPLNRDCNPSVPPGSRTHLYACVLARFAMTVFLADPSKFSEYHYRLMEGDEEPKTDDARRWAIELVGRDAFRKGLISSDTTALVERGVNIYGRMEERGIPQVLLPTSRAIIGKANAAEELHSEFDQLLRVATESL